MRQIPVSVLMASYINTSPGYLEDSLESLVTQTWLPEEIILVADGPLAQPVERVIEKFSNTSGPVRLKLVRSKKSEGLAAALNLGLPHCSCDFVARMDDDDICYPTRFEKQYSHMLGHPEIDVLASWHAEFENDDPETILRMKRVEQDHQAIADKMKWRLSVSHPTVMFKKSALLAVGGYRSDFRWMEDYELFMRMVSEGYRFHGLQEPLVKVRVAPEQMLRRGGVKKIWWDVLFRYNCYRHKRLSLGMAIATLVPHVVFRLTPPGLKPFLYRFVRKKASE